MQAHIDKINEMATVMRKAIEVDEGRLCEDEERIKQLEVRLALSCLRAPAAERLRHALIHT